MDWKAMIGMIARMRRMKEMEKETKLEMEILNDSRTKHLYR